MKRVCVYCGSSPGRRAQYAAAAAECGRLLATRGLALVYGGGNVGLMNVLADAALAAGGEVIGVIPSHFVVCDLAHGAITTLVEVANMHERKQRMADLADAFVALPGGIGTLEEVIEAFTWLQLGLHRKPVGLLNVAGYYDALLQFLAHMETERFLKREHREMLLVDDSAAGLLDKMQRFAPRKIGKWMDS
jgi:uncharacterized protein (TIGR00730 family)